VNVNLLIDAIVRQTTILIAQIATAAGTRAPLAHTANQVFMDLVHELREQGLGNKVIADMFGISLRTYHNTVRRLSEGNSVRGQSLWEAILSYVKERGTVSKREALARFSSDDDALVRGVLKDLVGSGLLFQTGRGDQIAFRYARPDEHFDWSGCEHDPLASMVWVTVYRQGPVTLGALREALAMDDETALESALARLLGDGRIERCEIGTLPHYTSTRCNIPVGAEQGWEAAVFDHYQALVTAITGKLRLAGRRSTQGEVIGGSTYSCDVWEGHPLREEALGFLAECRRRGSDLVRRVDAYNAEHAANLETMHRVYAYVGQSVIRHQEPEEDE
jgi:hypothetical protein